MASFALHLASTSPKRRVFLYISRIRFGGAVLPVLRRQRCLSTRLILLTSPSLKFSCSSFNFLRVLLPYIITLSPSLFSFLPRRYVFLLSIRLRLCRFFLPRRSSLVLGGEDWVFKLKSGTLSKSFSFSFEFSSISGR